MILSLFILVNSVVRVREKLEIYIANSQILTEDIEKEIKELNLF